MRNLWRARRPNGAAERERRHAVTFSDPDAALRAVIALRQAGFDLEEAHTPFPVPGMDEALGVAPSRVPYATLVGGAVGATAGFGLQAWTHAVDWPLNIGGKTMLAWPALIPITFETTVLFAALATVGALLFKSRLYPSRSQTRPASQPTDAVTDDQFVLVVVERDGSFSMDALRDRCRALGAEHIDEGWRTN